jgi:hypothetical protein
MAEGDAGQGDTGAGGGETSFRDGITDEGMRGNEHLGAHETLDSLATDYIKLKDSQPVLPGSVDDYKVDIPTDIQIDEADFGAFKTLAHENGMTNEVFEKVMQFDFARSSRIAKADQETHEAAVTELKTELGDKYDAQVEMGKKVLTAAGRMDDLGKDVDLGNTPALFRLLNWVGEKISEDQLEIGGGGGTGDTRTRDDAGKPALGYKDMPTGKK